MSARDPEYPVEFELQETRNTLGIIEALVVATGSAREVLDILLAAADWDEARTALQARYLLSEIQANAVMDLQFRRVTTEDRRRLSQRRDDLVDRIRVLEQEIAERS